MIIDTLFAHQILQDYRWPKPAIFGGLTLQFQIAGLWFFIMSATVGARSTASKAVAEDY
ncbi:MAG: hypothetical protein QG599_1389 [Pseudomonadota bacterium]|nr:hypothetical protein [Pseudomonadota bacterium]